MGYRLPSELEALEIMERLEHAIELKIPVTLTFFKEKEITHTYRQHGRTHTTTYKGYVPAKRRVEPWMVGFALKDGHPYVRTISLNPTDEKGPFYRTIPIGKIAVSTTTGKPFLTLHPSRHRYCQGLIDIAEAREAAKAAAAH